MTYSTSHNYLLNIRQVGVIFGRRQRTKAELDYFGKVFAYLLLLSQERGPHATGVAWLKRDGKHYILKAPQKALHFVRDSAFPGFLGSIDSDITWLAGHTRWQTVGDASNNRNNHPLLAGSIVGTHYAESAIMLSRRAACAQFLSCRPDLLYIISPVTAFAASPEQLEPQGHQPG